jgi:hypothetical protein
MMGQAPSPEWPETRWLLRQFSEDGIQARKAYEDFVRAGVGLPSIWEELSGQIYLGSREFIEAAQASLPGQSQRKEIPRMQRLPPAKPLADYAARFHERDDAIRAAFASGDSTLAQIAEIFRPTLFNGQPRCEKRNGKGFARFACGNARPDPNFC